MGLGDYNNGILKEGQIRISPSQVSMLSDNELAWYKSRVLGENVFNGNTATRLGNVVHYHVESILKGIEEPKESEVIDYLESQDESDMWRILDESKQMVNAFKDNYKLDLNGECLSEYWLEYEPNDKVMLSGTADIINGECIWDIKTTSKIKSSIGDYWMQLYMLVYLARKNGIDINQVGIIYLVSPTKTLGARYVAIKEDVNEEKLSSFITWLQTKVKKIIYAKDHDMVDILLSSNLLSFRV